jgi:hypothetical protein
VLFLACHMNNRQGVVEHPPPPPPREK